MSARDHRTHGREHEQRAQAVAGKYDPRARATAPLPFGLAVVPDINTDGPELSSMESGYSVERYNPTERYLEKAERHHQHAREHYAAALELEEMTTDACLAIPAEVRPVCPLLGAVVAQEPVDDGVRFVLARGADAEVVATHMRCHQSYGVERHFAAMNHCALYLPGLRVVAEPDSASVVVHVDDLALLPVLRSRALSAIGGDTQ